MSFSKQPTKKELTPFQEEAIATNQQNTPVPYLAGERLIAVRWITPALDKVVETVPASGKKG